MTNYLNEETLTEAYILDGVNPKIAKLRAKINCLNNPYEKEKAAAEKRDLKDATKILGGKLTLLDHLKMFKCNHRKVRRLTRLSGVLDLVGVGLFSIGVVAIVVGLALAIRTAIIYALIYFCYNYLLVNAFNFTALTVKQILIIAFIFAIILPGEKSSKKTI